MWSIKDLERQKECQTLVYELAKVQTKVTRYLAEDLSTDLIEDLSSEVDMLAEANRRIVDKYLKKESLYQDYLKCKSLLESDLKHILEVIFPDLTEEDRELCLAELHTGQSLLSKGVTELENLLPVKVIKLARIEDLSKSLRIEGDKVRELRGDLESAIRGDGVGKEEGEEEEERMMKTIERVIEVEGLAGEVRGKLGEALGKVREVERVQEDPQLVLEVKEAIES